MPRLRLTTAALVGALALMVTMPARAELTTMTLEGRLSTVAGGPVADGAYPFLVSLYESQAAKDPLHYEAFLGVPVSGGVFFLVIGAGKVPLDGSVFSAGKAAWVGVEVGSDGELPRVPIRPVPYAISAQSAAQAKDLACSACVGPGEVAPKAIGAVELQAGAVGSDHLAAASVKSTHVDFTYAASDTKGGPALTALAADTAKLADLAAKADAAVVADTAATADKATLAAAALALQCTGCIAPEMLSAATLGAFLSSKGGSLSGPLTVGGKLVVQGALEASAGAFSGPLSVGDDGVACSAERVGAIRFAQDHFYGCTSKGWSRLDNQPPPAITKVEPKTGPASGGTLVTITGTDFAGPVLVTFGALPCTNPKVVSETQVTCTSPAASVAGAVDVRLSNADGQATTAIGAYTYTMPASCKAAKLASPSAADGLYWIAPAGYSPLQVWCDMTTDGGGWTLAARIVNNSRQHLHTKAYGVTPILPTQAKPAKLSDALINALKTSTGMTGAFSNAFRFLCGSAPVQYFPATCGFSAPVTVSSGVCHDYSTAAASQSYVGGYGDTNDCGLGGHHLDPQKSSYGWHTCGITDATLDGTPETESQSSTTGCGHNQIFGTGQDGLLWVR